MTQDKQKPFDFKSMFDQLKIRILKNCTLKSPRPPVVARGGRGCGSRT